MKNALTKRLSFQHQLVICSPKGKESAKSLPLLNLKEKSFIEFNELKKFEMNDSTVKYLEKKTVLIILKLH